MKIKVSVMHTNAPVYWSSLAEIQTQFIVFLETQFLGLKKLNYLDCDISKHVSDDLWIFPPGTAQASLLNWLRRNFPKGKGRPPCIFFWGGEGAKLGYHIHHYKDVFRSEDQWSVACESERELINSFFPNNDRTHLMFYPVAKDFCFKSETSFKNRKLLQRLDIEKDQKILLYAGRISAQKNVLSLFDFIKEKPKWTLLICGDVDYLGHPHLKKAVQIHLPSEIETLIAKFGISKRVRFLPFQSQEKLSKIMRSCDAQVSFSSHYGEDFGYSIAQGLCSGLPTILSHWGGHKNWKTMVRKSSISFVPLRLPNEFGEIVPLYEKIGSVLVKGKMKGFARVYKKQISEQFGAILDSFGQGRGQCEIESAKKIETYWGAIKKAHQKTMFENSKDELYRYVVRQYRD